MNKRLSTKTFNLLALMAILGFSTCALAAPPANDTFPSATPANDGFGESIDTTGATTDSDDSQLNASCGAPATDASVWHKYTADSDGGVVVNVSQSNYSAGALVGVGTQGNLQTIACGPQATAFYATAGTTYYILAIDDQTDGGNNGGLLNITFNKVLSPTLDDLTVNKYGSVNTKTGVATISGSYTCSHFDFIDFSGSTSQKVGRVATIQGNFYLSGQCDGLPHPWSVNVVPNSGKFAGGKSMSVIFHFGCGLFECRDGFSEHIVQLRGGK